MHSQATKQFDPRSYMTSTPGERLKAAREACGFDTAKEAALAMGVPIATYTQHEKAEHHLPARRAAEYAGFFKVQPEWINFGRGTPPERVPVLDAHGNDTGRTAVLPCEPTPMTRALEATEGDGIAHFGFVALYNEPAAKTHAHAPEISGQLCVVAIPNGNGDQRLIRLVQKGSAPDRFHLIGGPLPLIDHKVVWLAPVIALLPA